MAEILVAFSALGFFAAGLLSVFWMVAVAAPSAFTVMIVADLQGMPLLHAIGLSAAAFALAQIGYGLGLFRVAALRGRCTPD